MTFSLILTGETSYVKEHYHYWQKQYRKLVERIPKLIEATALDSYAGLGKPEPFKYVLSGFWSRRINEEYRMVYRVEGDQLQIAQLRLHY
jgi:toxin YoeB